MSNTVLTLLDATLALYPADVDGAPLTAFPVWMGACAERVRLNSPWTTVETRPSGRSFPRQHPLFAAHEVSIDRVWVNPLSDQASFIPTGHTYVLDLVWQDPEDPEERWKRRTYFGVTIKSDGIESQDIGGTAGHFVEGQVFDAEYYAEDAGTGTPPAPALLPPMYVLWVGGSGEVTLYDYDPEEQEFTAAQTGITTGRATLAYTGGHSGSFEINFAASARFSLKVVGGVLQVQGQHYEGRPPTRANLPRVEFWRGNRRVGALDAAGNYFGSIIEAGTPVDEDSDFVLFSGGNATASIGLTGTVATAQQALTSRIQPTGFTGAAFGTPSLRSAIRPTSIASGESFGGIGVLRIIQPTGIATGASVPSPALRLFVSPSGIASLESFGTASLSSRVATAGIATLQAFGTPRLGTQIQVTSISEGAMGTPLIVTYILPSGIAQTNAFGTPAVARVEQLVFPTGIATGAAFGTSRVNQSFVPAGMASTESFGTPTMQNVVQPWGISSGEDFGSALLGYDQDITAIAIPTGAVFGAVSLAYTQALSLTGITSGEAFGSPTAFISLHPTGITSGAAFGSTTVVGSFDPSAVTGLKVWLKADAITGLSNGDPVSTWEDSSSQNNDATQSGSARPTYQTSVLDSKPVVRFNGTSHYMDLPNAFSALTAAEIFIVVKVDVEAVANKNGLVRFPATGYESTYNDHFVYEGDSGVYFGWGSTVRKTCGNPTPSLTSFRLINIWSAASDWAFLIDGSTLHSTSSNTVGFGTVAQIGKNSYNGNNFLDGDMAELVIFDHKITGGERTNMQAYFEAKYPTLNL
jgi:hypothetical protein